MIDARLRALSALSAEEDSLIVEFIYHDRYCQFDVSAMELKHLPMDEIIRRHFSKAFAAVQMPCAETHVAVSSSSETNV